MEPFFPSGTNETQHDTARKNTFDFYSSATQLSSLIFSSTLPRQLPSYFQVWASYIKKKKKNHNRHQVGAEQQPRAPSAQTDTRTVPPAAQAPLRLRRSQLNPAPVQRRWLLHLAPPHGEGPQHQGAAALAFRHPRLTPVVKAARAERLQYLKGHPMNCRTRRPRFVFCIWKGKWFSPKT